MTQQIRYYKQDGTEYDFSKTLKIRITQTSNADMNIGVQKQKTAMQELIDWLNVKIEILENEYSMSIASGIRAAKMEAEKLLEKEKEQIIDAYYGNIDGVFGYREEGQEYYNQTYKPETI
jgi:hypothetical protein